MEENEDKIEETSTEAAGLPQGESDSATSATSAISATGEAAEPDAASAQARRRRLEKVGLVTSDKMIKTVVVRVERQVRHPKYKRYIRRRTKFMAHDEIGAHIGDIVRIVETRPLSARKRWRVVEIVQKAN
jgi:small subunit ribosomal protein S17